MVDIEENYKFDLGVKGLRYMLDILISRFTDKVSVSIPVTIWSTFLFISALRNWF